jgi:hypothetical protein
MNSDVVCFAVEQQTLFGNRCGELALEQATDLS